MKKKLVKITGIIALFMAVLGLWGYNTYFKPDPEVEQELNSQFGEDFFSFEDEEIVSNPVTENTVDSVKKTELVSSKEPGNNTPLGHEAVKEQGEDNIWITPAQDEIDAKTVTQDDISNKYEARFYNLQNAGLSRLDTLYSAAVQEYKQGKKEGSLNRSELFGKYLHAGTTLEANMDGQFYSTLNAMEAELKANNLSTDIIRVYEDEYESTKSAKRAQLFAKIR